MLFDKKDEVFEVEEDVLFADASDEEVFVEDKLVEGMVIGGNLNLRKEPSKSSLPLTVLPAGAKVEANKLDVGKEWVKVTALGTEGFVMGQFIQWNEE